MSLNEEYKKEMEKKLKALEEVGEYNSATAHVSFDIEKLEKPEGITNESLKTHVGYINELGVLAEVATANIAHQQHENDDKLTTVDGALNFGEFGFSINTQHNLKQQVDEDWLYGASTTAIDFIHNEDETLWLKEQRDTLVNKATELFKE